MTAQTVNALTVGIKETKINNKKKLTINKKKVKKVWFFMQNLASVANSVVSTLSSDVSISENDIKEKEIKK